jgi:hypothetical protein
MDHFAEAIRSAVSQRNWYAALAMALTVPDVCGRLVNPSNGSRMRYVTWWETYMLNHYQRQIGPLGKQVTFLTGPDVYALRCAFLHEGRDDITYQKARQVCTKFLFIEPREGSFIHNNKSNEQLQLQIDIYCMQIADAVSRWEIDTANNTEINERKSDLLKILPAKDPLAF